MAEQPGLGPSVDDSEDAYRAILYPWQWVANLNRPSSAAFDEEVFSVDLSSRSTPGQTRNRFQFVVELVAWHGALALKPATSVTLCTLIIPHMRTCIWSVIVI